jgi:hypothetical protein
MFDVEKREEHFKSLESNKETIIWILENQGQLRAELLSFYKKEFKEIDAALSTIDMGDDKLAFRLRLLEGIQNVFISHWQRSYDLVLPLDISSNSDSKIANVRMLGSKANQVIPRQPSITTAGEN